MNYFAECLAKFRSLTADMKEAFGGVETYAAIKELEEKYNVKLSFLIILIAINELDEDDIAEYLTIKQKITADVAKNIQADLIEKVIDPALEKLLPLETESEASIKKEDIINLFTKRLVESLKAPADVIAGLNVAIFQKFNEDEDLEEKIINILYNNDERLTAEKILIEDREVAPTVANWIKDFIKLNGSEMIDDLVLAQYLSAAPNAKKLNPEEKNLVRRVLKLYNNLSFFPESMGNKAVSDWQLIPYDKIAVKAGEIEDVLNDEAPIVKMTAPKEPIAKIKPAPAKVPKPEVKKILSPEEELEEALSKYAPGSLEYKAVVQEMQRLKKKK